MDDLDGFKIMNKNSTPRNSSFHGVIGFCWLISNNHQNGRRIAVSLALPEEDLKEIEWRERLIAK